MSHTFVCTVAVVVVGVLAGGPGPAWGQCEVFKLTADDAAAGDRFGWAVSFSGGTVLIGALRFVPEPGCAVLMLGGLGILLRQLRSVRTASRR